MLDRDLAALYGVTTKRLNEQVKRNRDRFPDDFMFRLTVAEGKEAITSRSQIATLKQGANLKYGPYVFTEHGAVMLPAFSIAKSQLKPAFGWFEHLCGYAQSWHFTRTLLTNWNRLKRSTKVMINTSRLFLQPFVNCCQYNQIPHGGK